MITVGDIIAEHRRSYPGRLALVDGEHRLTWPELDERVNRLANALRATGVGPGMRILWLGQNSFRVYELLGAAAKIGAMVCPGYWRWAPPEMAFAIEDFSPKVVIWQEEEIGSTVRAARAASPAAESALWLRHDTSADQGYEAFLASGDPSDPGLDVDPDSALLVIYTAAISGRACGSMLSHANLIAMGMSVAWLGDIDDTTVFLNSGPMFHIGNFQFYGIPVLIGRECAIGEAGEICVRGGTVHLGYWNRPQINAERFRGGWWHTTDLGRREPDGTITFLGTMTRMIKSGAENIFPAEVENCLEAHPAVQDAAVIGIPSERFGQDVKAVVVLDGTAEVSAADLIEHCRRHIASYKKPKTVEFLDALPRTQGFAKDYAALDEKFGGGGYPGGDNLGGGHSRPAGSRPAGSRAGT